jgi:hypothetical protein
MHRVSVPALVGLLMLAVPAPALARLPRTVSNVKPNLSVRPGKISYTGDGTGIVGGSDGRSARHPGHLHWLSYTRRDGRAHGVLWLDDCEPSCAAGTFHPTPVNVHVWRPRRGVFRRLTLSFRYHGKQWLDRRRAVYVPPDEGVGGYWDYAIVSFRSTRAT